MLMKQSKLLFNFIYLNIFLQINFVLSDPTLKVDVKTGRKPISPYIYGINFCEPNFAKEIKLPLNVWGGRESARYNWKNNIQNHGSDWFFENIPEPEDKTKPLPDGAASDIFVDFNVKVGANTMIAVPMLGWASKSIPNSCSFSVKKYGKQSLTNPYVPDCGSGVWTNGTKITKNDPNDAHIKVDASFYKEWINHLTEKYGTGAKGGVVFYGFDCEYDLWDSTHRDLHWKPVGTDEIVNLGLMYGKAIKDADKTAKTLGPAGVNYFSLFESGLDQHDPTYSMSDYKSHGNIPFAEWYLKQFKAYEDKNKVRILDYLDNHYFPQSTNAWDDYTSNDAANALRLRATRSLWDPTYVDESWLGSQSSSINKPMVIPRMKKMCADNYPGTKVAITEWRWGGMTLLSGALAHADILGIFGRESLDAAALWSPTPPTDPWAFAFRMFLNYDGIGSKFGDISVNSKSSNESQLAIYGSIRTTDKSLILIVINKDPIQALSSDITIKNYKFTHHIKRYRYGKANLKKIFRLSDINLHRLVQTFTTKFPPYSITLLEFTARNK